MTTLPARDDTSDTTGIEVDRASWSVAGHQILHDISCRAPSGRFTGLIGPNGSGKTTLLSLVAGVLRPSSGAVRLGGTPIDTIRRRDYARTLSMVEQTATTDLPLTVQQVVELGRIPHRGRWAQPLGGADEVVDACLNAAGLTALRDREWSTLSGGEKQKTQFARALAQQPSVLLLDEPTNHLDVSASLELLMLVRARGLTTVAAMHDLALAAMFCDHLVVLTAGRVYAEGAPEEVLTPRLIADVYGVDAEIMPHPRTGKPMVVLCEPGQA